MASFLSVVVCLIVTIFSTIKGFEEVSLSILFYLESIILGELNSYTVNSSNRIIGDFPQKWLTFQMMWFKWNNIVHI